MGDIGALLCGGVNAEGIAKSALDQLSRSINSFSARIVRFLTEDASEDAAALGPFCARVLLENACAALVGRLDSFRILYLSEFQTQPGYEYGKRAKSSFSWVGDVVPEEKSVQNYKICGTQITICRKSAEPSSRRTWTMFIGSRRSSEC
jgi:hypothetical protein